MPPALRPHMVHNTDVESVQPRRRSLALRLGYRELSPRQNRISIADIPTRNIYLDKIMDTNLEIMNVVLLGWTIDGSHMVSYRTVVSEFDDCTFSLQIWRQDTKMIKIADLELFDGKSFSEDSEVFFSVNETADQEFFVVRGEFRNWETNSADAEVHVSTCILASPLKGEAFSRSFSHTLPSGYVVAPRQITQDIMFINSVSMGVNFVIVNQGESIVFFVAVKHQKSNNISIKQSEFSAERFLASQLDSAPRLKAFSLVDYDLRMVQVVENCVIVLLVAFLEHQDGRSEQNRRGAFLLRVKGSPESDLNVRVLQYLEAPWRGRSCMDCSSLSNLYKILDIPTVCSAREWTNENVMHGISMVSLKHPTLPVALIKRASTQESSSAP